MVHAVLVQPLVYFESKEQKTEAVRESASFLLKTEVQAPQPLHYLSTFILKSHRIQTSSNPKAQHFSRRIILTGKYLFYFTRTTE